MRCTGSIALNEIDIARAPIDLFQYASLSQFPRKSKKQTGNGNGMVVAQRRAIAFVPTKRKLGVVDKRRKKKCFGRFL
jgi:hypothetical protein